jgi:hypothetical protein
LAAHARIAILSALIAASLATGTRLEAKGKQRPLEDPGGDDDDSASASSSSGGGTSHGPIGLGIILGEPTGLTGKLLFGTHGFQLHLGYGIERRGRFVLIGDYLFHFLQAIPPIQNAGRLAPYVGVGGRLGVRDDNALLGIRFPLGLAFFLRAAPIEFFVEIALGIGLIPETVAIIDGGIGGRFYF